jgi:hypothetical protein
MGKEPWEGAMGRSHGKEPWEAAAVEEYFRPIFIAIQNVAS